MEENKSDTSAEKFWSKCNRTENGCWEWAGFINKHRGGYGQTYVGKKHWYAHRLAYHLTHGGIDGEVVMHICDNPPCINPAHLRTGSARDNMADMATKKRGRNGREKLTTCPAGHAYTGSNLGIRKDGSRRCKNCERIIRRKHYERYGQCTTDELFRATDYIFNT